MHPRSLIRPIVGYPKSVIRSVDLCRGLVKEFFGDNSGIDFLNYSIKTCCGYSLEAPRRGASNEYPRHMFYEDSNRENNSRILCQCGRQ